MPGFKRRSYTPSYLARSCCAKLRSLNLTKRYLRIYVACFLAIFGSAFSITMLFPFLPFMVQFILPDIREEDIGKYAGLIASSMFLGRFFGSYVWGTVADIKGRRPVIIASCLMLGLCSAAFGFSVNLAMAIIFRFLVGLTNGVVGTVKAVISESSDNNNQSFGISLLGCAWSIGMVIGPAVSGAVADPIGQYNLTLSDPFLHGLLTKFPYCLPSLINLILCVIGAISTVVLLPETLGSKRSKKTPKLEPDSLESNSEHSSSSEDAQILQTHQTEPTDDDITSSSEVSNTHVDLGTLGLKPFAMQDTVPSNSFKRRVSSGSELGILLEHSELLDSDEETTGVLESTPVQVRNSFKASTGTRTSKSEDKQTQYTQVQSHEVDQDTTRLVDEDSLSQAFDIGEGGSSPDAETSSRDEGREEEVLSSKGDSGSSNMASRSSRRRRSSFLVPFFNRRESFTMSFFKPSLSALRQKQEQKQGTHHGHHHRSASTREEDALLSQEEIEMEEDREKEGKEKVRATLLHRQARTAKEGLKKTLLDLRLFLCTKVTALSLLIYCIFSFSVIGFDEVFSLWAAAAPHLGGLGWTLHEIGISLAITGALVFPFTFSFPAIERKFGLIIAFHMNAIVVMMCMTIMPNMHLIPASQLNALRWVLVIFVLFVMRITVGNVFCSTSLFINNSVVFSKLGSVNGLAVSLTAAVRTLAPIVSGSLFSLSVSRTAREFGFPIDYHLIFIIFGIVVLSVVIMAAFLPVSINRQKVEEEEEEEEKEEDKEEKSEAAMREENYEETVI